MVAMRRAARISPRSTSTRAAAIFVAPTSTATAAQARLGGVEIVASRLDRAEVP
jgi:hypothetical protein